VVGVTRVFGRLLADQDARPAVLVMPDANGGDKISLQAQNTPLDELLALPAATVVPRFWLAAGAADGQAVADAETFRAGLLPRQASVPLTLTPDGGHTMTTWRAELPLMLSWMTPRLAQPSDPGSLPRVRVPPPA
jgi:enterochelin esterase-like enzyme